MTASVSVFRLRLFGMFGAQDLNGNDITPRGRKARALAAYIALSGGKPIPRERLAALLWGQRAEEQARASLRQTFYELRMFTAADTPMFLVEREHVRLLEDNVVSDVSQMRRDFTSVEGPNFSEIFGDRLEELLIDLDDVDDDFDEWLAVERTRLGDERAKIGLGIAEHMLHSNCPAEANQLVGLLRSSDPFNERALCVAIEAMCKMGDGNGARRTYARYEALLNEQLGARPSADLADMVETMLEHTNGAALRIETAAPPPDVAAANPSAKVIEQAPDRARSSPPEGGQWTRNLVVLMVAVLALVGMDWLWHAHRLDASLPVETLQVQPLRVPANDMPAHALSDGLGMQLAQLLLGRDIHLAIRDAGSARSDTGLLMNGEAAGAAGNLRVEIHIIEPGGGLLWSGVFSRSINEVDDLREQIAVRLAGIFACAFGHHPLPRSASTDTLGLFLAACDQVRGQFHPGNLYWKEIVRREPQYAHGWATLAAATAYSAESDQDRQLAEKYAHLALNLDPSDGEAYFALVMLNWGDITKASRYLNAGLAAEPSNPGLNSYRSFQLAATGRMRQSLYYAIRTVDIDPFGQLRTAHLIQAYAYNDRLNESGEGLTRALRRWPTSPAIIGTEFDVSARMGDPHIAAAMLQEAEWRSTHDPRVMQTWHAFLTARMNPTAENANAAEEAIARAAQIFTSDDDTMDFVQDLTELGRIDAAFKLWERRRPATSFWDVWFRNYMAPLRADPRFMTIAADQGIAQWWISTGQWPDFCTNAPPYNCVAAAKAAVAKAKHQHL